MPKGQNEADQSPDLYLNFASHWKAPAAATAAFSAIIAVTGISKGFAQFELIPAVTAIAILLFSYFALISTNAASKIGQWIDADPNRTYAVAIAISLPFWIFASGTGTLSFSSSIILLGYIFLPVFLIKKAPSLEASKIPSWHYFAIICCLWLPFDFRILSGVWLWPEDIGAYSVNTLLACTLASVLFISLGKAKDVGLPLRMKASDWSTVLKYVLVFCAIAIPIGLDAKFILFQPTDSIAKIIYIPISIFFFVALPEELLFRGIMQNLLDKRWAHPVRALVVTSILFGLSHVNNEPTWNLTYVGLGTVAGLFYGSAYMKTKNLLVPSLIHCAVDSIWILLFFGRG